MLLRTPKVDIPTRTTVQAQAVGQVIDPLTGVGMDELPRRSNEHAIEETI